MMLFSFVGSHFNKLADNPGAIPSPQVSTKTDIGTNLGADMSVRSSTDPKQATAQEEAKMKEILSNPEIRMVLMDPKVQELFGMLRTNPEQAHRCVCRILEFEEHSSGVVLLCIPPANKVFWGYIGITLSVCLYFS